MKTIFYLKTLLLSLFFTSNLLAQCVCTSGIGDQSNLQLYWVGGNSTNFNDVCNWRLNSILGAEVPCQAPRSNDNVFFMNAAFSGTSNIILIDQNSNCDTMIWDNAITAAKGVRLTGVNTSTNLDIYGNLELATNMNVAGFNGNLRFNCTQNKVVTLLSRNQNLRLYNMHINLAANAELRLLDNLTVNNIANNNTGYRQGGIELNSGHFNTNGQNLNLDKFYSRNGNTTRRLTLDNSYLNLNGEMYIYSAWSIDFNSTNNSGFSAVGSHLDLVNSSSTGTLQYLGFGTDLVYDSISIDRGMGRHYLYPACNITTHYFEIKTGTTPLMGYNSTIKTEHFKIGAGAYTFNLNLHTNNFHGPTGCATAVMESIRLTKKTAGGTLAINNIVAQNVDGMGASTYVANTCYEGGGCSNITFNTVSSCNTHLRFTDAVGNQDWQNVGNWVVHSTGLPATHIPTPWSNVYFDGASFPNALRVALNNTAFCKDIRWQGTPAGADLQLTHHLFLNGTLEFDTLMAPVNEGRIGHQYGRGIICMSSNNDSIISKGIYVTSGFHFMDYSRYDIVDTLCSTMLYQFGNSSHLTFNNTRLQIYNYLIYNNSTWTNSTLNYLSGGWTGINSGGTPGATFSNSTFNLNNAGNLMISARMPNVVVNGPGKVFAHSTMNILGDLTVNYSSLSSMKDAYSYTSTGRISVAGDMHIAAGVDVMLNSNPGSYLRVQGNVYTTGSCSSGLTSIRTDVGNPSEFTVNGTASNIQNTFLQGLDASAGQALTATNSTDGGNNTNITLTTGTGQTFYWVEDMTNPGDLNGNWSNPNHWTTTAGKINGDGTCIPSIADTVLYLRSGSSCTIDGSAFCKVFETRTNVSILTNSSLNVLYIAGDFITHANTTNNFYGIINMVGSGIVNTNGVNLVCKELVFNKVGGIWDFQSDISLNRNTSNVYYNLFVLAAGTVNTNGYKVFVKHRFSSISTNVRVLNLGTSIFEIGGTANYNGTARPLWDAKNSANLTINGGFIHFLSGNNDPDKAINFGGNNLMYDSVLVENNGIEMPIYGNTNFRYAEWAGNLLIRDHNNYDSLTLNGGFTYRFLAGKTQTLNAPYGNLKSKNTGPSSFINIESTATNQLAYFHKEYGSSFCLNYIKVKDVKATKAATQPAACLAPDCWALLDFQTDQNSDSISILNSDWGIWKFKLAPLVNPISFGADTIIICKTGVSLSYPIQIIGSSPYIIDYSWVDANNAATNGGQNGILVYDDDNDPNTPYTYNVPLNPIVNSFDYTVNIATSRCGNRILSTPVQTHVIVPTAQPLVQTQRTGSCVFENESNWYAILDDVNERPIVSLLDSVSPTDVDSLGLVNAEVFFEPTVQTLTYNAVVYPYLQRHWQITPANKNIPAKVRLYFTKAELTALSAQTFVGRHGRNLDPTIELVVLKYEDGTFPTATSLPNVITVPHTVRAATAADWAANPALAAPFSATTDLIVIEFDVSSFSHFVLIPTPNALLSISNLVAFDAALEPNNSVKTTWSLNNIDDLDYFEIQASRDYNKIRTIGTIPSVNQQLSYTLIDENPFVGHNYYRLKTIAKDGTFAFSDWKQVYLNGIGKTVIYPNPTSDNLNIQLYNTNETSLQWQIIDPLGRLISNGVVELGTGVQNFAVPTLPLSAGSYLLQLKNTQNGVVSQFQFVKRN